MIIRVSVVLRRTVKDLRRTCEFRMSMSSNYSWVTHEQFLLITCAWAWAIITDELRMSICSYYWRVAHEHEHLLLLSNAWALAVITYEFRMSMSSNYSLVTHEHGQLFFMSCAWAWGIITDELGMSMCSYILVPRAASFFFLIVERVALGPSKNIFFFIGCRKPDAL